MEIMHKIKMDLAKPGVTPRIPVVQGDTHTRKLTIALYSDRKPWPVPSGASVVIRYRKPDRTSGTYDTLSDGTDAVNIRGNTIHLCVAPEVVSLAGTATLMVTFLMGQQRLSTFSIDLLVAPDCVSGWTDEEGAAWIAAFLPSPEEAEPGQHLVVDQVDDGGHVLSVKSMDLAQWLETFLEQKGIEQSVSISHAWDGTILTVSSANGTSSADLRGKSAYEVALDNGFQGTEGEWLASLKAAAEDGSEILLGQTPITLSADATVKLVGSGAHSYSVNGKTIADLSTFGVASTKVKLTEGEDYIELVSTGSTNWYESYATFSVSGLTVGTAYILSIIGLGLDTTNLINNGYFLIKNASGTELGRIMQDAASIHSVEFTPDTANITIGWYPAANYYWNNNYRTARIADIYINAAADGTTRTDVLNESGTFTDSFVLGQVSAGVTITTDPSCQVYKVVGSSGGAALPLEGKKVVCFGDSLFGMYTGDTSAPAYVAERTGATVYNVGFGGCRMSVHPYTGYGEFSMWALAKAIATGDWSAQDAAAASGSANFPDQLAILKGIDFADVDYIVIHYGTNDFTAGAGVAIDNASDPKDYNTLCGALRYSIETLLGAYPELRIFVSLPAFRYWTADDGTVTYPESYTNVNGNTLPEFVEALSKTAKEYNLPVIDSYYGLGINKVNAATFLADGVHHNVTGRKRFGDFIGSCLVAPSVRLGSVSFGDASHMVVTFTTDDSGKLIPSHTYAQIAEWVNSGGSVALTNGNTWYNLAFINKSQVWFERTIATAASSSYTRYIITSLGYMDKIESDSKNINVTATVGQTIIVKEVDETGKPTAWEAVDHQPRTHYYEEYTGLLFEHTQSGSNWPGNDGVIGLIPGETYTGFWDGAQYTCTAVMGEMNGVTAVVIGNFAYFGLVNTGEPFVMFDIPADNRFWFYPLDAGSSDIGVISVTGKKETLQKLDAKYLPAETYPYHIYVTGTGTTGDPYICSETVAEIEAIYNSGREMKVKFDDTSGYTIFFNLFLRYVASNAHYMFMFSCSSPNGVGNILLSLTPQDDGTYSISASTGE